MAPGLVSKGFLIDPPDHLPLVLHGLFWYFPNRQATQGGGGMILMSFLGIIPLLDSMRSCLKYQWLSLWFQTRISLLSCPKRSSVDQILSMSLLVSSSPTASLSTYSKLVDICDVISVIVRRSSPSYRLFPCPKIRVFQVSPQGSSCVR